MPEKLETNLSLSECKKMRKRRGTDQLVRLPLVLETKNSSSYTTQLEFHGVSADIKERKNNRNKQQQNKTSKKKYPPAAIFNLRSGMGMISESTL